MLFKYFKNNLIGTEYIFNYFLAQKHTKMDTFVRKNSTLPRPIVLEERRMVLKTRKDYAPPTNDRGAQPLQFVTRHNNCEDIVLANLQKCPALRYVA